MPPAHCRKRVHVTTDEGFETLPESELQVQHAAVGFHQGESIKLAFVTGVFEYAEVTPIDFETIAWRRFHPQKGAVGLPLRASGVHILAQDGVPTGVTQWMQSLFHDGGRHGGVFFQPFGDGGFEWIQLALALTLGGRLRRRIQILLDGPPIHAQVALDLADRPALGPIQAMQVVDLIGGKHGATSVIRQRPADLQDVVVCKIPKQRFAWRKCFQIQTCAGAELLFARFWRRRAGVDVLIATVKFCYTDAREGYFEGCLSPTSAQGHFDHFGRLHPTDSGKCQAFCRRVGHQTLKDLVKMGESENPVQ